jgi:hypothetical protein
MKHDPGLRNYTPSMLLRLGESYPVVIPMGTLVERANFSQETPHRTGVIEGFGLVFRDCNLLNVEIDPSWDVTGCQTAQIRTERVGGRVKRYFCGNHHDGPCDERLISDEAEEDS